MRYTTVRVKAATRDLLRELADREGTAIQMVLEKAVETYRRRSFLEDINAAYEELRADDQAWRAVEDEGAVWEVTLGDGLPAESPPRAPARKPGRSRSRRTRT